MIERMRLFFCDFNKSWKGESRYEHHLMEAKWLRKTDPVFHQMRKMGVSRTGIIGTLAYFWGALEEAKNRLNAVAQETFHRGILKGGRNISDTP